jgi:hypothetical protein
MKNDLELLDGKIATYFNSVNNLFNYRLRNYWKYNLVFALLSISLLFSVLNLIPILPWQVENYLSSLIKLINNHFITITKITFFTKWVVGSALSLIIFFLLLPFSIIWDNKIEKKAAPESIMDFCYLFIARLEIKKYLLNERPEHLLIARKYTKKITEYLDKVKVGDANYHLNNILDKIKVKFTWFSVESTTSEYLNAFSSIQNKIYQRFDQKIYIEDLVVVLDWLALYEFSKIKPNEITNDSAKIGDRIDLYFKEFINTVNQISSIDIPQTEEKKSKYRFSDFIKKVFGCFVSSNILMIFFSWLILLSVVFAIGSIIVVKLFDLNIDTTFLIGLLSAPFLGAVTLSATIYSKTRK